LRRALPLVCAHRGARRLHPDNSADAFAAAVQLGADMLEADLRRASDGRLVLAHDPLSAGDAGAAMELEALVALARGRVALDIELKEAGYESEVLAALEPRPPGLLVTSFLPSAVAAVRTLDPGLPAGLLVGRGGEGDPLERAAACGATLLAPHVSLVDRRLLDRSASLRLPLVVWTVNDRRRLERLCREPAVAVLITDRPELALAARGGQSCGSVSDSPNG
jgi:glycerophosphoryl diester phosphodiesterase